MLSPLPRIRLVAVSHLHVSRREQTRRVSHLRLQLAFYGHSSQRLA
jgi:hypothetical protein